MKLNAEKILSGPAGWAIVVAVGGVVLFALYNKTKKEVGAAATAVANINKGTVYEGAGVVGTLGNVANQASGGFFQSAGEWIGGKLADWTLPDFHTKG